MDKILTHLNGNILCSIDTETTGFDVSRHEILQIALVPLDFKFDPMSGVLPFNMWLKPQRPQNIDPEALRVNKIDLAHILRVGFHPDTAADHLLTWRDAFNLPPRKKLVPLGKNWAFDREFIKAWLGPTLFEDIFNEVYARDLQHVAHFFNDVADQRAERYPFPKVKLSYIASQLEVEHAKAHDALGDCFITAECYKLLVKRAATFWPIKFEQKEETHDNTRTT